MLLVRENNFCATTVICRRVWAREWKEKWFVVSVLSEVAVNKKNSIFNGDSSHAFVFLAENDHVLTTYCKFQPAIRSIHPFIHLLLPISSTHKAKAYRLLDSPVSLKVFFWTVEFKNMLEYLSKSQADTGKTCTTPHRKALIHQGFKSRTFSLS